MKKTLIATLVLAGTLAAGSVAAQERRAIGLPAPAFPCPHPYSTTIHGTSGAPAPDLADFPPNIGVSGSVWNQPQANNHFGHTFHFPYPGKECCVMTQGTLVVVLKALQGGPKGSATSANDGVHLFSAGTSFASQTPWPNGATTGQTTTLTFTIPANILAKGAFSLYVQDDTAVVSADLTLRGCCLK